ncbi:MAG: hypothetical protein A2W85_12145 [Bacteroidetes bacterium GWF2_41_31]|nr:MAG: hypothetical protein A2W85_12145 [Bacteroidetes bacterium GWF2_41_31]
MRKFYFTQKRARQFRITYDLIDGLKRAIWNMQIENETHLRFGNIAEIESNNRLISRFEQDLKQLENEGWIVDYPFPLNK